MKKPVFLRIGALAIGASVGLVSLATPLRAQPLPVEGRELSVQNLSLKKVTPAEAETLAMPKQGIALHLRDVTLRQALDELQKQSGVSLDIGFARDEMLDKKLSVDLETRYFTPAFDAILDEAGTKATLQRFGQQEAYKVQFGQTDPKKNDLIQSGIGSFQVGLRSVGSEYRQTLTLRKEGAPTRSEVRSFSLVFDGTTDPIVNSIGSPLFILKRVEDEQGRSLLDAERQRWLRYNFDNNWSRNSSATIKTPAADVKKLARVEGIAIYVVPSARQTWEIADVAGSKDKTHEFESEDLTFVVRLKRAERDENRFNVELEMTVLGGGDEEANKNPLFSFGTMAKAFSLQDSNGNIFRTNGYSGTGGNNKMTMSGSFNLSGEPGPRFVNGVFQERETPAITEPVKLVFDAPTAFVQTEVPFSFTDVPLP